MASKSKRPADKPDDKEARRRQAERMTETGEGLILKRKDGTTAQFRGGKLVEIKDDAA